LCVFLWEVIVNGTGLLILVFEMEYCFSKYLYLCRVFEEPDDAFSMYTHKIPDEWCVRNIIPLPLM
jgi:hypothetical protein